MPRQQKEGALAEYRRLVDDDELTAMETAIKTADIKDLDHVAAMYAGLVTALFAGKMQPAIASEIRETLIAATTLAAARAQGVFTTEEALDGTMALAQAARNAQNRRGHALEADPEGPDAPDDSESF